MWTRTSPLVARLCVRSRPAGCRTLATKPSTTESLKKSPPSQPAPTPISSCPANTVLPGLNYLKAQPVVQALPDEEYPPWLWTILEPKQWSDDGPGGRAERARKRQENRQRIKDQNFMTTQ